VLHSGERIPRRRSARHLVHLLLTITDDRTDMSNPEIDDRPGSPVAGIVDELAYRFDGVFSRETVDRTVHESYDLPVLAGRFARERLTAAAKLEGLTHTTVPEVLFLCVHNAGRSQMAAALLDQMSGGKVHVRSAGSEPGGQINPVVTEVMAEIGIELTEAFPKPLTDDIVRASDVIVTMGCGDACPVYPGKRYLDWELPDPAGLPIQDIRPIRDQIQTRVATLLDELLPDRATS
jgi:protein-tyrosine-phosphatase